MQRTFHRKFIAIVLSAAVFVTGIGAATGAQARDRDAQAAIAALLGLAVIGTIIAKNKRDDDRAHTSSRSQPKPHVQTRPLPQRAKRRALPQGCLRNFQTDFGNARMFGKRCMERNYRAVHKLPQACARKVFTDRGVRRGWGARCLRQKGFQIARN